MSFIVRVAEVLGIKIGQKHAYRVRREALTLLRASGFLRRKKKYGLVLYRLASRAVEKQANLQEILLSATPTLSRAAEEVLQRSLAALRASYPARAP